MHVTSLSTILHNVYTNPHLELPLGLIYKVCACTHTHTQINQSINLYALILSPLDYVPSSLDLALNDKF